MPRIAIEAGSTIDPLCSYRGLFLREPYVRLIPPSSFRAQPFFAACIEWKQEIYFVFMLNSKSAKDRMELLKPIKALASPVRLAILRYLKDPLPHFRPQLDGDLIRDGVCADFIREKLGISAATASRHLTLLTEAGLLVATRKKGWTFYRRDESAIRRFTKKLQYDV